MGGTEARSTRLAADTRVIATGLTRTRSKSMKLADALAEEKLDAHSKPALEELL